ncbi:MAG: TolC family outer membrane protein [Hyphomicrobiales bacterium]
MRGSFWRDLLRGACVVMVLSAAAGASAMPLREAVERAVTTNPEIGEAAANREATQFELDQARSGYLPSIDLEARAGALNRDSATTRGLGREDDVFAERSVGVVMRQLLFDGFETRAGVMEQASRVDAASHRVFERSETIALAAIREYLDLLRLHRVVASTRENVSYHQQLLGRIREGTDVGTLSIADQQQAEERLFAAESRVVEAVEEVKAAEARFVRIVGHPSGKLSNPAGVGGALPDDVVQAIRRGQKNNPTILAAQADVDAAHGRLKGAEAAFYPKLRLEARARHGQDLGGVAGDDNELRAGVVLDWNLYRGGSDRANHQEQIRRIDEATMVLYQIVREVEEAVKLSWDRREQQAQRLTYLRRQLASVRELVESYSDQFAIGQRSLVDLLDAQNARVNAEIAVWTAEAAVQLAEYRILAATGELLPTLGVAPPPQAEPYARARAQVPPAPPPETLQREEPGLGPLY